MKIFSIVITLTLIPTSALTEDSSSNQTVAVQQATYNACHNAKNSDEAMKACCEAVKKDDTLKDPSTGDYGQVQSQCVTFLAGNKSKTFEQIMIGLDTLAATLCMAACAAQVYGGWTGSASSHISKLDVDCNQAGFVNDTAQIFYSVAIQGEFSLQTAAQLGMMGLQIKGGLKGGHAF